MSYTINPNAKNKWARNAENTMDLSLETDASSVYLDNGRTLEQEIGKGSMVSNVATVDNAMSKVIDGTLDGAYESLVFKGKSLVNLANKSQENAHYTDYNLSYIDKTKTYFIKVMSTKAIVEIGFIVNNTTWNNSVDCEQITNGYVIIKPNETLEVGGLRVITSDSTTSYTLKTMIIEYQEGMENWDIPYFTGLCDVKMPVLRNLNYHPFSKDGLVCWLDGSDGAKGDNTWTDRTGNGNNATLVNFNHNDSNGWTGDSLKFDGVNAYCTLSPFVADSFTINMVVNITRGYGSSSSLWYRQGGLFDAEAPSVMNDFGLVVSEQGQIAAGVGNPDTTIRTVQTYLNKKVHISLARDKEQGAYRLYINGELQAQGSCNNKSLSDPTQFILGAIATGLEKKPVFDCYSIMVYNRVLTPKEINMSTEYSLLSYVQTNILRTSEEIVLREVNGIQDTYNPLTGEYVRRIGEVVLNGNNNESWDVFTGSGGLKYFRIPCPTMVENNREHETPKFLTADKINFNTYSYLYQSTSIPEDMVGGTTKSSALGVQCIYVYYKNINVVNTFKQYLQSNPITIQYELAEPITTIVESLTTPFAYQNGHVILESGYEGQSLLPTLEYSTVVNKTGLIENVAKTIQRQEKQLTMLEKMLIQNIINLDYNNTLLALKNEMEEML